MTHIVNLHTLTYSIKFK